MSEQNHKVGNVGWTDYGPEDEQWKAYQEYLDTPPVAPPETGHALHARIAHLERQLDDMTLARDVMQHERDMARAELADLKAKTEYGSK